VHFGQCTIVLIYSHFAVRVPPKSPTAIGLFIGKRDDKRWATRALPHAVSVRTRARFALYLLGPLFAHLEPAKSAVTCPRMLMPDQQPSAAEARFILPSENGRLSEVMTCTPRSAYASCKFSPQPELWES
jgi:hypothetical protein